MALVCLCNGVSERKVARAVDRGATTVDAVGQVCGAGTGCHGCVPAIETIIDRRVAIAPRHLAVS